MRHGIFRERTNFATIFCTFRKGRSGLTFVSSWFRSGFPSEDGGRVERISFNLPNHPEGAYHIGFAKRRMGVVWPPEGSVLSFPS
jgi:hypothetical protein